MSVIDDLAAVVRAGCDEDAEAARHASRGPWWAEDARPASWGDWPDTQVASADGTLAVLAPEQNGPLNADHIARQHPKRTLAEVSSRRALLDEALAWEHADSCPFWRDDPDEWPCDCDRDARVTAVLRHLAAPYTEET